MLCPSCSSELPDDDSRFCRKCGSSLSVLARTDQKNSTGVLLYALPDCIREKCGQVAYSRWLHRKAMAHVKRDRKRGMLCTVSGYKERIHRAVCASGHIDFYTGEPLDWSLISTFDNQSAKDGGTEYKKKFALLPTIDHAVDSEGRPNFVICSWRVNDAKSDLTLKEFFSLCESVLAYRDGAARAKAGSS
jgi:hypothetical protein